MLEYGSIEACKTGATSRNALFQFLSLHTPSVWERTASDNHIERGFLLANDDHIGLLIMLDIKS